MNWTLLILLIVILWGPGALVTYWIWKRKRDRKARRDHDEWNSEWEELL